MKKYYREVIDRNSAKCLFCGEEIESKHQHDFVTCGCGSLSVDGGHAYGRRCMKDATMWEDTSITHQEEREPYSWEKEEDDV